MPHVAGVAKKLKKVRVGASAEGPRKTSSARRQFEARVAATSSPALQSTAKEDVAAHGDDRPPEIPVKAALTLCQATEDFDVILSLLAHPAARVRVAALEQVCPCRLRGRGDDDVWRRVIGMTGDGDLGVRKQVLHTLCDGSPDRFELEVVEAIESFNREPDRDLRRMAHKVLAAYQRTGVWNIM